MWAIRDIKHGKTFHFKSLDELILFVNKIQKNEKKEIIPSKST